MVNQSTPAVAEQALALSYAPADARAALRALWALDRRLGEIVRGTREPMIGQMRLTWWHEALTALGDGPVPAEPVLAELARTVVPTRLDGAALATLIDGWEALLDLPEEGALDRFAEGRGGRLFILAARLLGASDRRVEFIGQGWALADLARHVSNPAVAALAAEAAASALRHLRGAAWSRALRPLAALALLARSDLEGGVAGSPARIARLLSLRLTGRRGLAAARPSASMRREGEGQCGDGWRRAWQVWRRSARGRCC